jgi:chromosome segregation ATPase
VTKQTWDALGKELNTTMQQKLELENQLSILEINNAALRDVEYDIGVRLGKLRYQNEANKAQKAAMGRSLSEKEVKIKTQQLEIDELVGRIKTKQIEVDRAVRQLAGAKAKFEELNLDTSSGKFAPFYNINMALTNT